MPLRAPRGACAWTSKDENFSVRVCGRALCCSNSDALLHKYLVDMSAENRVAKHTGQGVDEVRRTVREDVSRDGLHEIPACLFLVLRASCLPSYSHVLLDYVYADRRTTASTVNIGPCPPGRSRGYLAIRRNLHTWPHNYSSVSQSLPQLIVRLYRPDRLQDLLVLPLRLLNATPGDHLLLIRLLNI